MPRPPRPSGASVARFLTSRAIQPIAAGLEALGHAPTPLLQAAGIPQSVLADPDGRVSAPAVAALWDLALTATGDDCLGIHLAEKAPVASFEVHAHALLSSPTLREAYRRGTRYQRLIHEVTNLTFEEGPDSAELRHALPGGRAASRQPAEFLATAWVRIGRLVTGIDWVPIEVDFAHPAPDSTKEHARVFRGPIRFGSDRTAIRVANQVLDIPNARADEALGQLLDRYAATLLARRPVRATLSDRVRSHLIEGLGAGLSADQVARALNLSVRSLHRGLASEGTSYRQLKDQLQRERAVELLASPRYSIAEVGFLLGFAEISSFYRAFKRWFGHTPAEARAPRHS